MSDKVSNPFFSILLGITIVLALFSAWVFITDDVPLVGLATGRVNVTVNSTLGLSFVTNSSVNFTLSNPGDSKTSLLAANIAGCGTDRTCGFNLSNDGNVEMNISMINSDALFTSTSFSRGLHFSFNVTPMINTFNRCGANFYGNVTNNTWSGVPTSSVVVICALNYTAQDTAMVDINVTVPTDETAGAKIATVTFTASSYA